MFILRKYNLSSETSGKNRFFRDTRSFARNDYSDQTYFFGK